MQAVVLPALTVRPPGCLRATEFASDAQLAVLWEEAQRGVEIRRAFDLRYRYSVTRLQKGEIRVPSRNVIQREKLDTIVNIPDSVIVQEQRRRERNASEGYGQGNTLTLPDEKELLDDGFLVTHCVETPVATVEGTLGLRFRPVDARRKGYAIAGTIWVDSATYLMRRLQLEYQNGERALSTLTLDYADVDVAGSPLRLPSRGAFVMIPANAPAGSTINGTLAYSYSRFEDVRSR
jgi:hypothetical protein